MTRARLLSLIAIAVALATPVASGCAPAEEAALSDSYPLGVYMAWERVCALAQRNGLDKWTWVERCLDDMVAHNLNAVWVVNLGTSDLRPLADRCAARGIGLVPGLAELHYQVDWRRNNWEYLEQESKRAIQAAGDSPAILAWCLCDEPRAPIVDEMETFRRKFHEWGAKQPAVVVSMWMDSPTYADRADFGALCTDVYPFFSDGNPNGPNSPAASRGWYRRHSLITAQKAYESGKAPWLMPQSVTEVWGPQSYNADGFIQARAGSLVHLRTPQPSEIRWQLWSGIAAGLRGFFFYVYDPDPAVKADAAPYTGEAFPPGFGFTQDTILPTSGAFIRPDGRSTDQYDAAAQVFAQLKPLLPLLKGAVADDRTMGEIEQPGWLGSLANPRLQRHFAVVVNDDPDSAHALKVWLVDPRDVRDLRTGEVLHRAADNTVTVTLAPGDGTLIEPVAP